MFQILENGTWTVPATLPYLAGHFPERPVLPAVALIDATVHGLRQNHGVLGELRAIVSAKFSAVIEPGRTLRSDVSQLSENEWLVHWLDGQHGEKLAEIRLRFSGQPALET